jgi:basic amino acid/polyamine antiporter, APA family
MTNLQRSIGLFTATMMVIGSMIGSGIFKKPAAMAAQLQSGELLVLVWIVAGVITVFGALTNAEIASMFDKTGGQYVYFRRMYGDFVAYLYGWTMLAVVQSGSQAAIAYVFAEYLGFFIQYPQMSKEWQESYVWIPLVGKLYPFVEFSTKWVAVSAITLLTVINYFGVQFGGFVQNLMTVTKLGVMVILVSCIFIIGNHQIPETISTLNSSGPLHGLALLSAFGLALSGAFWAYDGWNNVTFISGEIKNPQNNLPKALFLGTMGVILVYVVVNVAYLYILPLSVIAGSKIVAATAANVIFGATGAAFISAAVMFSSFGSLNGSILSSARVPFAMAQDGLFFKIFSKIHPRFHTPGNSLIVQGIWSSCLVFSGTFDIITDYVIFAAWLFYALGAFGVFVLRKKMPDTPRAYKVWAYPMTPIVFIVFATAFLINTIVSAPFNAAMGLFLILLGLPFLWLRKWAEKVS